MRIPVDIKNVKRFINLGLISEYIPITEPEVHEYAEQHNIHFIEAYEHLNIIKHLEKTGDLVCNPYILNSKGDV